MIEDVTAKFARVRSVGAGEFNNADFVARLVDSLYLDVGVVREELPAHCICVMLVTTHALVSAVVKIATRHAVDFLEPRAIFSEALKRMGAPGNVLGRSDSDESWVTAWVVIGPTEFRVDREFGLTVARNFRRVLLAWSAWQSPLRLDGGAAHSKSMACNGEEVRLDVSRVASIAQHGVVIPADVED